MAMQTKWIAAMLLAGGMILTGASGAWAQEATESELATSWDNLMHAIKTADATVAQSTGQNILRLVEETPDQNARELYRLSVDTPAAMAVLARGARLEGMEPIVKDLRTAINKGFQLDRSDPDRIAEAIKMLTGTLQQYQVGRERLRISGEYALPQLMAKLMNPRTEAVLLERIPAVLADIGKPAVRPLAAATESKEPRVQEVVANALGEIGYPHAVPQLKALMEREGVLPRTKQIAELAIRQCGGKQALEKPLAELYYQLGEKYYYQAESLLPDSRFATANVWYWKEGLGLEYVAVPREIFCHVYAMRNARQALAAEAKFSPAVPLWLASYLQKENRLPEDATDPTVAKDQAPASTYIRAAGATYAQQVLARALKDDDSRLAIQAIDALAETAGAENLTKIEALVQALSYPDRRVRFRAALAIANARPSKPFVGSTMVTNALIEALGVTGGKTAMVVASDPDERNRIKASLGSEYRIIEDDEVLPALRKAREANAVDIVVFGSKPAPMELVRKMRNDPLLAGMPVVIAHIDSTLRDFSEKDKRVLLVASSAQPAEMLQVVNEALTVGVGEPMTPEQASDWAVKSSKAIQSLGRTDNQVLQYKRSAGALQRNLNHTDPDVQIAAAWALSIMPQAESQRAIAALALNADAAENVRVEAFNAATESVRQFGNDLEGPQSAAVVETVGGTGSQDVRAAAGTLLGMLNLESDQITPLILESAGTD